MEYRAWIAVPGLPFEDEARWEPFIERLEQNLDRYGPVLGWSKGTANVIVSTDAENEAAAKSELHAAIAGEMRAAGLPGEPTVVEMERDDETTPRT